MGPFDKGDVSALFLIYCTLNIPQFYLYLIGPVDVEIDGVGLPGTLVDDVERVDDAGANLRKRPYRRLAHHLPAVQDVLGADGATHGHLGEDCVYCAHHLRKEMETLGN
jgi:hypothetical protein